jgi:gliding motility-associated-like protein
MLKFSALLVVILFSVASHAQVLSGHHTYRVTAYQKGNNNIWSRSNYVEQYAPEAVFVPNAFTPNSDGTNDTFHVNGENLQDFKMLVYDRWGQVIFETTNPNEGWDGTYNGKPEQNGTYVYQVTAKNLGGKKLAGGVTLVR